MKEILLHPGVLLGSVFFCLLANTACFQSGAKNNHSKTSGKITEKLYAVKAGMTYLYIITEGNDYICIDAGSNLKRTKKELTKLGINPDSVKVLFLTHSDQDHIAGLCLFKEAQVYLSIDEEEMVRNKKRRLFGFINNKLPQEYYLLNDKCEVNIGNTKVLALATPGHTTGSFSYLVNGRMLFTGDALSLKKGKVSIFTPRFFNMDEKTQENSISKLSSLQDIDVLGTAHDGFTNNFEFAIQEWRK